MPRRDDCPPGIEIPRVGVVFRERGSVGIVVGMHTEMRVDERRRMTVVIPGFVDVNGRQRRAESRDQEQRDKQAGTEHRDDYVRSMPTRQIPPALPFDFPAFATRTALNSKG